MPLTGEEIRANLTRFVARWSVRDGYERGEAQTFLTELFDCYGQRLSDVAEFERFQAGGFIDLNDWRASASASTSPPTTISSSARRAASTSATSP